MAHFVEIEKDRWINASLVQTVRIRPCVYDPGYWEVEFEFEKNSDSAKVATRRTALELLANCGFVLPELVEMRNEEHREERERRVLLCK